MSRVARSEKLGGLKGDVNVNVKPEQTDCLVLRHRVAAKSLTSGSVKLPYN